MPRYRLDLGAPPAWAPLERICALCAQRRELPQLCVDDFMYMGCLVSSGRPSIHLYKNAATRHYLCLDDGGHAFRVRWRRDQAGDVMATCSAWRCLPDALTAGHAGRGAPARGASP